MYCFIDDSSQCHRTHLYDVMRGGIFIVSTYVLCLVDMSRLYHSIRGQAMIKLYVLFTMIEVVYYFLAVGEAWLDFRQTLLLLGTRCIGCAVFYDSISTESNWTIICGLHFGDDFCRYPIFLYFSMSLMSIVFS